MFLIFHVNFNLTQFIAEPIEMGWVN